VYVRFTVSFSGVCVCKIHCFVFRGVCMYRTKKIHDEIMRGIPDSLRGEIWMVYSGAINEVSLHISE